MPEMLVVDHLSAGYGTGDVLADVSFTLEEGAAMALLGRNGVGKSTLVSALMGLTDRRGGHVHFFGEDISNLPPNLRNQRGIGLVPQERQIFRSLTVLENLQVSVRPGKWTLPRVLELFPSLGRRKSNLGNQLSGGEQQMLAIGRALLGNPKLILLDEPFEGLAPVIVDQMVDALAMIRSSDPLAVILVEHHVELALDMTEHAIVLDRGDVIWRGSSAELRNDSDRLSTLIGLDDVEEKT